jgi:site-specific DNA-methyltransferase (adenine-specific)
MPYSQCRAFIAKAALEATRGCTVVALVPARTDTKWWHAHVWDGAFHRPRPGVEVRFLPGRLKFSGSTNSAPFPSVVLIFRPPPQE